MSSTTAAPTVTRERQAPQSPREAAAAGVRPPTDAQLEADPWAGDWAREEPSTPAGADRPAGGGNRRNMPALPPVRSLEQRRRRPTGKASHPVLLLSGEDHSGKSFAAALFTGDERVGRSYWLEVGRETTADWYGAVPGADYDIVDHDGTWRDIMAALGQSHAEACELVKAADYDGRPPLLVVDSMTGVWEHLSQWAEGRALKAKTNIEALTADPHADIDIGALNWNAANRRHKAFMTLVLTWPGPVVLTARGKMAMTVDPRSGNLKYNAPKVYTLECNKSLPFDVTMHVRLDKTAHPEVLGYRHPTRGIGGKGSKVKSLVIDPSDRRFADVDFSASWLMFGVMKYEPTTAVVRVINDPSPVIDHDEDLVVPAARRLLPEAVRTPGADEAPGDAVPDGTEPRTTR